MRSHQIDSIKPVFWMLPGVSALREAKYRHEMACGDLYVAFHTLCEFWERHEDDTVEYDRKMVYRGLTIFFEVDLGTESPKIIESKLSRYRKRFQRERQPFFVIFALKEHRENVRDRGHKIIPLIREMGVAGNFYLLCHHAQLVHNPTGEVLYHAIDDRLTGLLEMSK